MHAVEELDMQWGREPLQNSMLIHWESYKLPSVKIQRLIWPHKCHGPMLSEQSSEVSQPLRYQMVVQEARPQLRLFVNFDKKNIGPLGIPEPEFSYTSYKNILIRQQLQHTLCITRCLGLSPKSIIFPDRHDPKAIIKQASTSYRKSTKLVLIVITDTHRAQLLEQPTVSNHLTITPRTYPLW